MAQEEGATNVQVQEEGTVVSPAVNSEHNGGIRQGADVPKQCKYSRRVALRTILGLPDGGISLVGQRVVIGGWVKSCNKVQRPEAPVPSSPSRDGVCNLILQSRIPYCLRTFLRRVAAGRILINGRSSGVLREEDAQDSPGVARLQVNDGSCASNLQVLSDSSVIPLSHIRSRGTCILAEGVLQASTKPDKQKIELKLERILHVGIADPATYPFTKTKMPLDFLRNYPHFRPRTTVAASVTRVRSALVHATQAFFQNHGFLYVHAPIITTSNAKGHSEVFQVTASFGGAEHMELTATNESGKSELEAAKDSIREKHKRIEDLKRTDSNKETLAVAVRDLQKAQQLASQMEESTKLETAIKYQDGKLKFSDDFFSQKAFLTASAQLHLESYACALGNVYTCGPTFQAGKNRTTKHLSESWMVEAELAFTGLEEAMLCAEDYLKFLCQWILDNCLDDIRLLEKRTKASIVASLQLVTSSVFERVAYTSAVQHLAHAKFNIEYGEQLSEEHERYLTDEIHKRPVILYNYPKEQTHFHTRINEDGTTAAAFDILLPKGKVLISGSQREERVDAIIKRIHDLGYPSEQYGWYIGLRRHGSVVHAGFSLGLEQMLLFITGLENARDVVPFPRFYGKIYN